MSVKTWVSEEEAYIREHWPGMTDAEIAAHLGRTVTSVAAHRRQLGMKDPNANRTNAKGWSTGEVEQMRELWGQKTIPQIAAIMGRSVNAVKVKSTRLGLGAYKHSSEYLPALQVSDLLGVDVHAVTNYWIPKLGPKFKKIAPLDGKTYTYIRFTHLLKWLEAHQNVWDSRRVEPFALGCEPAWLKEKRRADLALPARKCAKWTPEEDTRLIRLFRPGDLTNAEIGARMGRSASAVEHRLLRLDVWGTGGYVGETRQIERRRRKEQKTRHQLLCQLRDAVATRFHELNWDGYWQKEMCMNWSPARGCLAGAENCDVCGSSFVRIRPQYCARCGATFLEREENRFCGSCRIARKKQSQRKFAIIHGKKGMAVVPARRA